MRLVQHQHRFGQIGEHCARLHVRSGQQQIMIGDDEIGILHLLAGKVERAAFDPGTFAAEAALPVGAHGPPVRIRDDAGPSVSVARPCALGEGLGEPPEQPNPAGAPGLRVVLCGCVRVFRKDGDGPLARLQAHRANVAGPTLGHHATHPERQALAQGRNVLVQQLLLQCNRGGSHHQMFAAQMRQDQRRQQIAQGLARAGTRLDDCEMRALRAPSLIADRGERVRHRGHHPKLRLARGEARHALTQGVEAAADQILFVFGEHGTSIPWPRGFSRWHAAYRSTSPSRSCPMQAPALHWLRLMHQRSYGKSPGLIGVLSMCISPTCDAAVQSVP